MRIVTAADAIADICPEEQVFLHGACATPSVLLDVRSAAERSRSITRS
jgi:hypothetical protein